MKTGKLILKGNIKLLSACLIGSGTDENTDMDLLRDSDGNPFIPATSFIGVLRHFTRDLDDVNLLNRFWGSEDRDNPLQSAIYCKDLIPCGDIKVLRRDAVALDNKTGRAKDKAKFDFEIIERDTLFDLYMEIDIIRGYEERFKGLLATIVEILKKGMIRLGAKTKAGLGRISLINEQVYLFDFSKKEDLLRWLKYDFSVTPYLLPEPFKIEKKGLFELTARFTIKNSFIVRSYAGNPAEPDAVPMESLGSPLLPGTSLKGAIRARAERIINTLGKSHKIIDDLFGYVKEDTKKAMPSRLIIGETILPAYQSEIQTRIKIDRFTGGVIEGALLETRPLFSSKDELAFEISLSIEDCKDYEAGLMLLILKDLWTGDMAVGGEKSIGRGVFKGKGASINYNGKTYEIGEDLEVNPPEGKEELGLLIERLSKEVVQNA